VIEKGALGKLAVTGGVIARKCVLSKEIISAVHNKSARVCGIWCVNTRLTVRTTGDVIVSAWAACPGTGMDM
jgi:nucleoside-triphosphatase THEP1